MEMVPERQLKAYTLSEQFINDKDNGASLKDIMVKYGIPRQSVLSIIKKSFKNIECSKQYGQLEAGS